MQATTEHLSTAKEPTTRVISLKVVMDLIFLRGLKQLGTCRKLLITTTITTINRVSPPSSPGILTVQHGNLASTQR